MLPSTLFLFFLPFRFDPKERGHLRPLGLEPLNSRL
jgi:hypothetical protein